MNVALRNIVFEVLVSSNLSTGLLAVLPVNLSCFVGYCNQRQRALSCEKTRSRLKHRRHEVSDPVSLEMAQFDRKREGTEKLREV